MEATNAPRDSPIDRWPHRRYRQLSNQITCHAEWQRIPHLYVDDVLTDTIQYIDALNDKIYISIDVLVDTIILYRIRMYDIRRERRIGIRRIVVCRITLYRISLRNENENKPSDIAMTHKSFVWLCQRLSRVYLKFTIRISNFRWTKVLSRA